jgi:hypothetical protein
MHKKVHSRELWRVYCRLVVVIGWDCRLSTAALGLLYYPRMKANVTYSALLHAVKSYDMGPPALHSRGGCGADFYLP